MDNGSKGNMYHGTNEIYLNNLCIFKFVNSNITIFFILLLKFFFNFIKNKIIYFNYEIIFFVNIIVNQKIKPKIIKTFF